MPSGSHDEPDATRIARERIGMPAVKRPFAAGYIVLGLVQLGLLLSVIRRGADVTNIELAFFDTLGLGALYGAMDLASARSMSVIFSAAGIIALGMSARKLFQSEWVGLGVAAALVVDPGNLVFGQYATGHSAAFALQATALLMFLGPAYLHWPAGIAMLFAAALDPWTALWGVAFLILVLFRGHIYAAPQHVVRAMGPTLLMPLIGASVGAYSQAMPCNDRVDAVFLAHSLQFGDSIALGHPLVWILGVMSLLVWGLGALVRVLTKFKVSRQPGRIQFRLDHALPPSQGRFLWILLLWLLAPPLMTLPLLAFALAAAVWELSQDARGFGIGAAAVLLVMLSFVTASLWGIIDGSSSAGFDAVQGYLPWHEVSPCGQNPSESL